MNGILSQNEQLEISNSDSFAKERLQNSQGCTSVFLHNATNERKNDTI